MAAQYYEYDWHVWREEEIIPRSNALPRDVFFIQIRTRELAVSRYSESNNVVDDDQYMAEEPIGPVKCKSLWVKKNSLLYEEEEAKRVVYDALHSMGVPRHLLKVVIEDIVAWGCSMANYPPNAGRPVLPMVLGFKFMLVETTDANNVSNPRKRRRIEDSSVCAV